MCVSVSYVILGFDNGLAPNRRQAATIWTSAAILLIEYMGTHRSEHWNNIRRFSYSKMILKMLSTKCQPFSFDFNILTDSYGNVMARLVWRTRYQWETCGRFKNTYQLLNLRALKSSPLNKIHIFQCMGKMFCVEFQRYPLKFHTKYLTHTLKNVDFIQGWRFKSS